MITLVCLNLRTYINERLHDMTRGKKHAGAAGLRLRYKHKHMDFKFITLRVLPSHYCSYHHGTTLLVPYHLAVDFRTRSFFFCVWKFLVKRRENKFKFVSLIYFIYLHYFFNKKVISISLDLVGLKP